MLNLEFPNALLESEYDSISLHAVYMARSMTGTAFRITRLSSQRCPGTARNSASFPTIRLKADGGAPFT